MIKKWYQSKTLWVGIITILVGVLTWIGGQIEAGVPITVIGIVNVCLRLITSSGIISVAEE